MAVNTFVGCVLVNRDRLFADKLGLDVAFGARHVRMASRQGKVGACVVVECRRNPMLSGVAVPAMGFGVLGRKLPVVRVLVAGFALLRCSLESRRIFRRGLVTIAANDGAVRSKQGEFRFAVVKPVDVRPGLGIVASLAAERHSVCPFPCHAVVELALVRILVAGGASPVFKFERKNLVGAAG